MYNVQVNILKSASSVHPSNRLDVSKSTVQIEMSLHEGNKEM